jgi:hypothetical protein
MGDLHLPPGRGRIPLEELFATVCFPRDPTVCVELLPDLRTLAKEAVEAARRLAETVVGDLATGPHSAPEVLRGSPSPRSSR